MNDQNNTPQPGSTENADTSAVYLGDSTLQSPEEFEKDKNSPLPTDEKITASGVDDTELNSDGAAGIDRAGSAERKDYGDTELNKGLESQAMDEES